MQFPFLNFKMNFSLNVRKLMFNTLRHNSSFARPIIKVLCMEEDETIRLSFKLPNSPNLKVIAPKEESVHAVLSRIKLMANLQQKREEIRKAVMNKLSNTTQLDVKETEEDFNVDLMQGDILVDDETSNREAWAHATKLKIGDTFFDVRFNLPSVVGLTLPKYVLSGCYIRPKFLLECANLEECSFTWYRSQEKDKIKDLTESDNVIFENEKYWLKVGTEFVYGTCDEDIGCFLKVVCTPKRDNCVGFDYSTQTVAVVEKVPDEIPFVKRHQFTNTLTGDDSIRCVSYNTLANTYVERRKYPYCSEKARDSYYRKQLLLKELIGYNGDILCLQEVEERVFNYDIFPVLKKVGLEGCYKKKGGRRYEGLACFYRTSKFKLIDSHGVLLNEIIYKDFCKEFRTKVSGSNKDVGVLLKQDSALQILILQHVKHPNCTVLVANTHLYSNKDSPEVRLIQATLCTQYVEHLVKSKGLESAAVLFCGDFNSLPKSDTFDFMNLGKSSLNGKNNSDQCDETPLTHNLVLSNACGTPEYTNYTEEFYGCLDYIFYSRDKLKVSEIVPMPNHEDVIADTGLPNEYFPSDHIALVCTLKFDNS